MGVVPDVYGIVLKRNWSTNFSRRGPLRVMVQPRLKRSLEYLIAEGIRVELRGCAYVVRKTRRSHVGDSEVRIKE